MLNLNARSGLSTQHPETLFEAIVKFSHDAILVTGETPPTDDPHPKIIFVNPAFERMTGYSADEVIGKTPRILQGPNTDRSELDRIRQALLDWEPVRAMVANYRKDGEEFICELDIVPFLQNGAVVNWIAIQRDVTARVKRLKAENEAINTNRLQMLAAGVAHDFNNMLQVISGFAEIIESDIDVKQNSTSVNSLRSMHTTIENASALCYQLLSYAGQQSKESVRLSLSDQLDQISGLLKAVVGPAVGIEIHLTQDLPFLLLDPIEINQIILNLVANAAEACGRKGTIFISGGSAEITSIAGQEIQATEFAFVEVADQGPGIPPDIVQNIFEPYFSTKANERGLGLASSLGLARSLGGDITVYRNSKEGTAFRVVLPIAPPSESSAVKDCGKESKSIALVVDDHHELHSVFRAHFATRVSEIVIEENVANAKKSLEQLPEIAFAIVDVALPDGTGLDLLESIRARDKTTPVILISGNSSNSVEKMVASDPKVYFVPKPFSFRALHHLIDSFD
ncbi:MAG: PAS domain S-box protein [Planctomycetota bacterium]